MAKRKREICNECGDPYLTNPWMSNGCADCNIYIQTKMLTNDTKVSQKQKGIKNILILSYINTLLPSELDEITNKDLEAWYESHWVDEPYVMATEPDPQPELNQNDYEILIATLKHITENETDIGEYGWLASFTIGITASKQLVKKLEEIRKIAPTKDKKAKEDIK